MKLKDWIDDLVSVAAQRFWMKRAVGAAALVASLMSTYHHIDGINKIKVDENSDSSAQRAPASFTEVSNAPTGTSGAVPNVPARLNAPARSGPGAPDSPQNTDAPQAQTGPTQWSSEGIARFLQNVGAPPVKSSSVASTNPPGTNVYQPVPGGPGNPGNPGNPATSCSATNPCSTPGLPGSPNNAPTNQNNASDTTSLKPASAGCLYAPDGTGGSFLYGG